MRALVVYDSKFGQTAKVAEAISAALKEQHIVRILPVNEAYDHWPNELDLLILGSPTHKHNTSQDMHNFLESLPRRKLLGVFAAAFDTRYHMHPLFSGSAAVVISKGLQAAGCMLLSKPESFFVEEREGPLEGGEPERARMWTKRLLNALPQSAATI